MKVMVSIAMIFSILNYVNAKIFRDNARNVVIDTDKKIMWQDNGIIQFMDYREAYYYCKKLKLSGYNDWSLPPKIELQQLGKIYSVFKYTREVAHTFYWSNEANVAYSPAYNSFIYERVSYSKNNVKCIRFIKKHNNNIVQTYYSVKNLCNNIRTTVPMKPNIESLQKRPYETDIEFNQAKENIINRWKAKIYSYEKKCNFIARINYYRPSEKKLNYTYDIDLPGLGNKTIEDIVSPEKAFKFLEKVPGEMTFTAILGMNENEKFYIKKVIYPSPKKKKEVTEDTDDTKDNYAKTGILLE